MDSYGFNQKGYYRKPVLYLTDPTTEWNSGLTTAQKKEKSGFVIVNSGAIDSTASGFVTYNLPELTSSADLGIEYTFVKLTTQGLRIDAYSGDYIADSGVGGRIQNTSKEIYATITLISVTTAFWIIAPGAVGSWTTTLDE